MSDALTEAKWRLTKEFDQQREARLEPFRTDQWVANSLLQKSIRRSETEVAQRAALTFLTQKGSAIWRRFIIIAVEDVGAASADVVAQTVAASTNADWRKELGGDLAVAVHLAGLLAEAPKSRSAEHLITSALHHPSFETQRLLVEGSPIADILVTVADKSKSLGHRALAACRVSGVGSARKPPESNLPGLLETYRGLGVPEELVAATEIATARVRDPITLMANLVGGERWPNADRCELRSSSLDTLRPSSVIFAGQTHPGRTGSHPLPRQI